MINDAELCGGESVPTNIPLVCALSVGIERDTGVDQSAKINTELATAAANNTGLFFPAGKYRVDGNINVPTKGSLVGSRTGTTLFYSTLTAAPLIGDDVYANTVENLMISDIIFDNIAVSFYGNTKRNITVRYNAFINTKTLPTQTQLSVAHGNYIIKGNVFMRGRNYPGVGLSTYKNNGTTISYNFLGSASNKDKASTYIDTRTANLITKLVNAKNAGQLVMDDDQGNYVSGWYATDELRNSSFFRNFYAGNTQQMLFNPQTQLENIQRDHIIYIKQYDNVNVYQNYFTGWPTTAAGQLKFRNAENLVFAANYLDTTNFDARPYNHSPKLFMRNTYIFNNYINEGKVTFWQNFDDSDEKSIDVVDYLVFSNTFSAADMILPRITRTARNRSNNFYITQSSNLYTDTTTEVVASSNFTNITLEAMHAKIPADKQRFLTMTYIAPQS